MIQCSTMPNRAVCCLLLGTVLFAPLTTSALPEEDTRELKLVSKDEVLNVILITISSLRADHTGIAGYARPTTPNFDSFAQKGTCFTHAFATSSWMMPAHGSIFTSLYPSRHGATHINNKLTEDANTLAEVLSENGHYCAGFCFGPRLNTDYGYAQGFDFYDDFSLGLMESVLEVAGQSEKTNINQQRTNHVLNAVASRWLKHNTHQPFFLFMHYYDNHWDYLPPSPYDKAFDPNYDGPIDGQLIAREPLFSNEPSDEDVHHIKALYDGEIKQTDADLGEILQTIRDLGLDKNSIIIVMGDHGQQFYEHGHTSHHGLWEELVHVPIAISIPSVSGQGKEIEKMVSQVDIMPTIFDILSIPIPPACQGQSFKPLLSDPKSDIRRFLFMEYSGGAVADCFAVRSSQYKVVVQEDQTMVFDLQADPTEQHPLLGETLGDKLQDYLNYAETCRKPKE